MKVSLCVAVMFNVYFNLQVQRDETKVNVKVKVKLTLSTS